MTEFIKLQAPEGFTDVSFGGENYTVENGVVSVPEEAAVFLYQFGFSNIADDAPAEAEQPVEDVETPEKGKRGKKEA